MSHELHCDYTLSVATSNHHPHAAQLEVSLLCVTIYSRGQQHFGKCVPT